MTVGFELSPSAIPGVPVGIDEQELAGERLVRSALAGLAGVMIVVAALLLERACRVRRDDP